MAWPAPLRFSVLGFETLGYRDEVILPIAARAADSARPMLLRLKVEYLTCDEICIPYEGTLGLTVPPGRGAPSAHDAEIRRFEARVPGADPSMAVDGVTVSGSPGKQRLSIVARATPPLRAPDVYVEGPERFGFSAPRVERLGAVSVLNVGVETTATTSIAGEPVIVTLVDGERAAEFHATVAAGMASASGPRALAGILLVALLGGLILNLMPCVLPVLSLKLMGLVGAGATAARPRSLATAAGIIFSMGVLAALAIALKSAGLAVGWGIQFQSPLFLIAMAVVLVLFACNLCGVFDLNLPGAIADRAARAGGESFLGHFATGAFATLLATPCSAPFLGTALGFALARGAAEIAAVFAALGIGMAMPYLLVAAVPALARALPKPGHWMVTLRRFLGMALVATALWLLWVLAGQRGGALAGFVFVALVLMTALLVLAPKALRWAAVAVLALAMLAAPLIVPPRAREAVAETRIAWAAFAPDDIPKLLAQGKIVLVDVTADWCLTCKVNERLVLSRDGVASALVAPNVVAMRADWTNPDPRIAAFLARFGRYGIPFNAVFGPGAPAGVALPELLTEEAVLDGLRKAQSP